MTWSRTFIAALVVSATHASADDVWARPSPQIALAEDMVAAHNAVRTQVGAPPVHWDNALARQAMVAAQRNLDLEELKHTDPEDRPGQGENLASALGGHVGAKTLLALWVDEKSRYGGGAIDCDNDAIFRSYGHYTQMIWRSTARIGCAMASNDRGQVLACRYWPAGNICGATPRDEHTHLANRE